MPSHQVLPSYEQQPPSYTVSGNELPLPEDEKARKPCDGNDDHTNLWSMAVSEPYLPPYRTNIEPGLAPEYMLTRGLQVPSRADHFTSGFAYPAVLHQYGVTKHHWQQFTQELTQEVRLSRRQWTTAIGRGLGVLAVGGLMLGFFSVLPAAIILCNTRTGRERKNLAAAMTDEANSELSRKIQVWNETFFRPRGLLIRVDLPCEDLKDMDHMDVSTSRTFAAIERERRQHQHQQPEDQRRESVDSRTSQSSGPSLSDLRDHLTLRDDATARDNASIRGRIVIIPLHPLSSGRNRR